MSEAPSGDTPVPRASGVNEDKAGRLGRSGFSLFRSIGLLAVLIALGALCLGLRGALPGLEPWSSGLRSADPSERLAAVQHIATLGRNNPRACLAALVRALHDPDAKVRAAAAKATVSVAVPVAGVSLGRDHVNATISTLLGSLVDPDAAVRAEAAQAAWMFAMVAGVPPSKADAGPIVMALIDRLGDGDASVRLAAIRGLSHLGPKVSDVPPAALVAAMDDESEPDRLAAALAVAEYRKGLPRLLPSMVASYCSGSPRFREALLRLIEQVHPPQLTPDVLPGLVAAVQVRDIELVKRAIVGIARFRDGAGTTAPVVGGRLQSLLDEALRARASGNTSNSAMVPTMIESLGRIGRGANDPKEAVSALAKALRADFETSLRIAAAKALSVFPPSPEQFAALSEHILDPDLAVRHAVIWAIHDVDYAQGYLVPQALAIALEDASAQTREDAAAAICHSGMGADPFVPALVRHAMTDPNRAVRGMCITAISMLYPPKITASSVPHLVKGLESPDSLTREAMCSALRKLGRAAEPAIPALIRILGGAADINNQMSKAAAAVALGAIAPNTPQSDQAVAALIDFLQLDLGNNAAWWTIDAIADFGPKASRAVPRIRELQERDDQHIRDSATKALSKIEPGR